MEIREDGTVCRLIDPFIKEQDQGRQQGDTNDNSDDNSFCHNDSKVASQSKCHKTQCSKSGHCRDGTSDNGFECITDRMCHRTFFVIVKTYFVCLITFQKEDGIIHRNSKLKYCGQRLCDVGYLSQKDIGSHIVKDG